jgi:hypothetical protein
MHFIFGKASISIIIIIIIGQENETTSRWPARKLKRGYQLS